MYTNLPAICNTSGPVSTASSQYRFIPTIEIIEALESKGFTVINAKQSGKGPFGFHTVDFTLPGIDITEIIPGDKVQFRGRFSNSHDLRKRWHLSLGIWRQVCSNGLIAMTDALADIGARHLGTNNIIEGVYRVIDESTNILTDMRAMSQTLLSADAQQVFASQAAALRWPQHGPIDSNELLNVRRPEDAGDSVWLILNRVQENILRGGQQGRTRTNRLMTVRPIRSLLADDSINRQLWQLAKEYMQ